jgi:hypothetical protein
MVYFHTKKSQLGYILVGHGSETVWYILLPSGIFYGHLVHFMTIWYSLWPFGTFFQLWFVCTKKNLATLVHALLDAPFSVGSML